MYRNDRPITAILAACSLIAVSFVPIASSSDPCAGVATKPLDCEDWTTSYDADLDGKDVSRELAVGPDDEVVYMTGESHTDTETSDEDYVTVALDIDSGDILWTARDDLGDGGADDIAVTPNGKTVIVTGSQGTVAYDTRTGDSDWFNGASARHLEMGSEGNRVFASGSETLAINVDNGTTEWTRDFGGPIAVAPSGAQVYAVDNTFLSKAFSATNGSTIWSTQADGSNPKGITVSPDGSTLSVAGWLNQNTSENDYVTVSLNTTDGQELWNDTFDPAADDKTQGIEATNERVLVTGFSEASTYDFVTLSYDLDTGDRQWTTRLDRGNNDWTEDLVVGPNASVYVIGASTTGTSAESAFTTVSYDVTSGEEEGRAVWDSTEQQEWPFDVGIAPDGDRLYVSGTTQVVDHEYAAVSYTL